MDTKTQGFVWEKRCITLGNKKQTTNYHLLALNESVSDLHRLLAGHKTVQVLESFSYEGHPVQRIKRETNFLKCSSTLKRNTSPYDRH